MPTLELEKSVTFKNIVVATDFSEVSNRALECASAVAEDNDAKMCILHAAAPSPRLPIPLDPLPGSLDRELTEAQKNLTKLTTTDPFRHLEHEEIAVRGPVWDVVENVLQEKRADLLVLGTHGRTGFKKLVLGSVAEELFRRAACPVLTVGPAAKPAKHIRRVLYATDFGPASQHALPYAVDFADKAEGELILLHLTPPIPIEYVGPAWYPSSEFVAREETDKQELLPKLVALLPSNEGLKCSVRHIIDTHYPSEGIVNAAHEYNADLIVMGIRDSGRNTTRMASHMPWAIAYEVVCNAECPVLTVRV